MTPVLVTGAASGIGLATARLLLDDGATIVGVDRDAIPDLGSRCHRLILRRIDSDSLSGIFAARLG